MSGGTNAFSPLGATVPVAAGNGATSASTALPGSGGLSAKVHNANTVPSTIVFSSVSGGAVALATSLEIAAGLTEVISLPFGTVDVACYGIGAAGTVYVTRGDGV